MCSCTELPWKCRYFLLTNVKPFYKNGQMRMVHLPPYCLSVYPCKGIFFQPIMRKAAAASTHKVLHPCSTVRAQTGTWVPPVTMDAKMVPALGVPLSLNTICPSVFIYQRVSLTSPLQKGHWRRRLLKTEHAQLCLHYLLLPTQAESDSLRWQTL